MMGCILYLADDVAHGGGRNIPAGGKMDAAAVSHGRRGLSEDLSRHVESDACSRQERARAY